MSALDPDTRRTEAGELKSTPLRLDKIQGDLHTARLGTKFHYFSKLESTNSCARRLAEKGAMEGEVVIAEQQTQGRGRLGRNWVSPPYVNLYFSVILRPTLPPIHAPQITLTAAVALTDAVAAFIPQFPVIKWPNDILVNSKKLAGILTESSCSSERIEFVILGIGVNVNFAYEYMPETIREGATSILGLAKEISREALLKRLIQDLDRCYGILEESGFDSIAPRWEARFGLRGRRVRVEMESHIVRGRAIGLDRDGALIVEGEDGKRQRIVAGDVIPVEE